jgi:hypothetical protein
MQEPDDPRNDEGAPLQDAAPDPVLRRQAILRVLLLTLVLLALPIGMVVWAVRDSMRKPTSTEIADASGHEMEGLRAVLEHTAEETWGEAPSLSSGVDEPVLPVLEWNPGTDEGREAVNFLRSQIPENPANIVLLDDGSSSGSVVRFLISPDFWISALRPTLLEKQLFPPEAPSTALAATFFFLEIYGVAQSANESPTP